MDFRITSYNVCYTKLLRYISEIMSSPGKNHQYVQNFEIITGVSAGKNNSLSINDTQVVFNKDFAPLS